MRETPRRQKNTLAADVHAYFASVPDEARAALEKSRAAIKAAAPEAAPNPGCLVPDAGR